MNVLVTGGAGFIGSHIAEALWRNGATVRVLDNFQQGNPNNIAWGMGRERFALIEADLRDAAALERAVAGCEVVYHQAAMNSVPRSIAFPLESNSINIDGTLKLLLACREHKVRRVIYASSSSVYGNAGPGARVESLPARPLAPYPLQKHTAEEYCRLFTELYGLETVSLRYFNVFGPRQLLDSPYAAVIPKFCAAALRGEAPIVYGDGTQARDFTFVENVVAANLLAASASADRVAGKAFNIAAGESVSLLSILEELGRLVGRNVEPRFEPARKGDVHSTLADISLARQALGYEPRVPWTEGLARTLEFYRRGFGT